MFHARAPKAKPGRLTRRSLFGAASAGILLLPACAVTETSRRESAETISLPVLTAWVDGRRVRYISTDASDASFARRMGINHAPRLSSALPPADPSLRPPASVLERVYMFVDDVQINVFQSAPSPVGPGSEDLAYSPLWRAVMVRWIDDRQRRELRSEESILAAEERGWVTTTVTSLVINCPIVSDA